MTSGSAGADAGAGGAASKQADGFRLMQVACGSCITITIFLWQILFHLEIHFFYFYVFTEIMCIYIYKLKDR